MKTGSRIVRLVLWAFVLLSVSACSGNGALVPAPDFSNPDSRLRTMAQWAVVILEGAGIGVILFGAVVATVIFLYRIVRGRFSWGLYHRYREHVGEVILLGLEFLVAGDIVGTVALSLRVENVLSLAAIIIVRTFLSFTLEVETTGYWPWQRGGQSRHGIRERIQQKNEELGSQPEEPALG